MHPSYSNRRLELLKQIRDGEIPSRCLRCGEVVDKWSPVIVDAPDEMRREWRSVPCGHPLNVIERERIVAEHLTVEPEHA